MKRDVTYAAERCGNSRKDQQGISIRERTVKMPELTWIEKAVNVPKCIQKN
jgi:hypothetical protein